MIMMNYKRREEIKYTLSEYMMVSLFFVEQRVTDIVYIIIKE